MELEIRLDAAAWKYLGEGNQNIVLQYAGRDARLCGRVLRLRKTTQDTQSADDAVRTCFEFLRNEMGPLLGDDVVNVGTLVQLPAGFAAAVSDAIRASRPASRTAKSLDARCTLGWLLPDLTLLESVVPSVQRVYVVEVKPKCGFVPSSRFIAAANAVKKSVCRYCMHQHLKAIEGRIDRVSAYCPLLLYADDDATRMRALIALAESPQNNLSIRTREIECANPQRGRPPTSLGLREVLGSAATIAAADSALLQADFGEGGLRDLLALVCTVLRESQVLDRILRAQRHDTHDVEFVHALYSHVVRSSAPAGDATAPAASSAASAAVAEAIDALDGAAREQVLADFGLAASAKDCSIIITIGVLDGNGAIAPPRKSGAAESGAILNNGKFAYRVAVTDLDKKPLERIPSYYRLDEDIVCAFRLANPNAAPCSAQLCSRAPCPTP